MAIKRYKPYTHSTRNMTTNAYVEITTSTPEKSLLTTKRRSGGRNAYGRITVRHIGGGNLIKLRKVDFRRNKDGIPATVSTIEYDPNRSAFIALLTYVDGEKRYILAPVGLNVGDKLMSGETAPIKVGNNLRLVDMPVGTIVHNVELEPNKGGQMARSAGTDVSLKAKEGKFAIIKLPSGEVRKISINCRATIGQVGNLDHELINIGKAGKNRHFGIRPSVRGAVMNPCDHPHGGGEGKNGVGLPGPLTPWGKKAYGFKTRNKHKPSNKFIIKKAK